MKIGFVFPGQGAQAVGMGKDLYDEYEEVREVYEKAKEVTGINVAKLTFESTEEELSQTKNTQIAILTMSLGILEILKKNGIEADVSAGLSLGEYAALVYSNIISLEEYIVHLVRGLSFRKDQILLIASEGVCPSKGGALGNSLQSKINQYGSTS